MSFQMRFFTFREIAMPNCSLFHPHKTPDTMEIESGETYYLQRDNYIQNSNTQKIEK